MPTPHRLIPVTILVAAGLVLAGCGGTTASSALSPAAAHAAVASHTLVAPLYAEIGQPIDPDIYYGSEGEDIIDNAYDTLVRYAPNTSKPTIVADLASSWSVSSDGLSYTFQLRQGVKFHDGTTFDCSAIAPDFARRLAVNQGPAYMVADVASVTCPNPYQAVIALKQVENDFLDTLASEYGPKMISPTALAAHAGGDHDQTWLAANDAGTGPYTVTKADTTGGYALQYSPAYAGPEPYYTTIDLPIVSDISTQQLELESGKATVLLGGIPTRAVSSLRSNKALAVHQLPTEAGTFLDVNPHAPGLSSPTVRQAILDAINPTTLVQAVYSNGAATPYNGVYPPHQFAGDAQQKTAYQPQMLSKVSSQLKGQKIVIAYETGLPNAQQTANLIQAELASGGVQATVTAITAAQAFSSVGTVTSSPSIEVSAPWPDASNPFTWAHIAYDPTGGLSYFQCPDPQAATDLAKAVAIPNVADAQQAYVTAGEDYASTFCFEWLDSQKDVMVSQVGLAGVEEAHSVMAPQTLFFSALHPAGS